MLAGIIVELMAWAWFSFWCGYGHGCGNIFKMMKLAFPGYVVAVLASIVALIYDFTHGAIDVLREATAWEFIEAFTIASAIMILTIGGSFIVGHVCGSAKCRIHGRRSVHE